MRKVLSILLFLAAITNCSMDTGDDGSEPLFAVPTGTEESNAEAGSQPLEPVPQPVPEVPVPQPIVDEPEDVQPHEGVRDLVGPKLVESDVVNGQVDVDVNLNTITLSFDENIAKSDVKIIDHHNNSLRWKRIINGTDIILTPVGDARDLQIDRQYTIFGIVFDEAGNERAILIRFTTGIKDKTAPDFLRTTVRNGEIDVDPDTDHFIFAFSEDIGKVRVNIEDRNTRIDLGWTHLIRGKEVVLHKLDKGASLVAETVYHINIAWADKAGNWDPGGFIEFTTRIKE